VTSQRDHRPPPLILDRFAPNHLAGVVAVLLFLVALILGAGVAVVLRALF
jgi:hypothetical protein